MAPQWFLGKLRSARCAVPLLSPFSREIVAQDAPSLRSEAILRASTITRGRPNRFPLARARAAANPERTRERISSLSNSAIEAKPFGVEVSTPSCKETKPGRRTRSGRPTIAAGYGQSGSSDRRARHRTSGALHQPGADSGPARSS
jgi:hypothetical protein